MDKNQFGIQTGQDNNLNSHTIEVQMFENMETTQLERKEREGQERRGASEKETQIVHISTFRKMDAADAIWEDKEETRTELNRS